MGQRRGLKLCRIVTVPQTFRGLLTDQLQCIVAHKIELTLVSSPGPDFDQVFRDVRAKGMPIAMQRKPAPFADLRSLAKLTRFLSANRFDLVHSSTPKAGLLTTL